MNDQTEQPDASYEALEKALREQMKQQPELLLARVMLLELYFRTGRRREFLVEARKLHRRIDNPATSLEWQRCASMGRLLDPTAEIFRTSSAELLDAAQAAVAASAAAKMRRFGDQPAFAPLFRDLTAGYEEARKDRQFLAQLDTELLHTAGRPTSLQHLRNLSARDRGAQVYLKREDLAPRDSHLTMMVIGQALLARRLGCKSLVTSTVNGNRGLIVAAMAARFGLKCVVYMDSKDSRKHLRNVFRMSMMDVDLQTVDVTRVRNHDVREVALQHWGADPKACFMITGLDAVPAPYPMMHREFTSAIGRECKRQVLAAARRNPDALVTRGSEAADALGLFPPFLAETGTRLACVEAPQVSGTFVLPPDDDHADPGEPLTDEELQLAPDVLEGMNYPSVEREHGWLKSTGRVEYVAVSASAARHAMADLAKFEGLIPSLGTARALAWARDEARRRDHDQAVVVMVTESDEQDLTTIGREFGMALEAGLAPG